MKTYERFLASAAVVGILATATVSGLIKAPEVCKASGAKSVAQEGGPFPVMWRLRNAAPVLINGYFGRGEWEEKGARRVGDRLNLFFNQDRDYFYLGIRLLKDMHTGLEVCLSTSGQSPKKLHVSATLGEAEYRDGAWGEMTWGRNTDWTCNSIGLIIDNGQRRVVEFEGFELQISKSIFAGRTWRILIHLKRPELTFPEAGREDDPAGWFEIRF